MKPLVLLPVLMMVLACGGTPLSMQIVDRPVYVCPTATPRSTDTPAPTAIQPTIGLPPSGWATYTAVPGCIWNGFFCAPNTPYPGGLYRTPGINLPGATSTPRPTTTSYPTPTSFVMRPPQDFYAGDAIYTGGFASAVNARLRLLNIETRSASAAPDGSLRSLVVWQIEIRNLGAVPYEVFPAWQAYVSSVNTAAGLVEGWWGASEEAVAEAGVNTELEAVALPPTTTRIFSLAAFIPAGIPHRFGFALDPTTRPADAAPGVPGSNLLVWVNEPNTICAGELSEPAQLPTPLG